MFLWDPGNDNQELQNLNLVRANIETESRQFIENKTIQSNQLVLCQGQGLGFGSYLPDQGLTWQLWTFYNGDGSTTIQYLTGANRSLGQELADHLLKPSILLNLSR